MAPTATILHADLDAFYASVEQLLDPSLRGKPIAVGGGVVLAASYEAQGLRGPRRHAGTARARTLSAAHFCRRPFQATTSGWAMPPSRCSAISRRWSSGFPSTRPLPTWRAAPICSARRPKLRGAIRRRVRAELGLPISVGVARTKHLAKIASQVAKPDGLVVVDPDTELDFLHELPVELMWGVGPVTKARLAEIGVLTIGQLAKTPGRSLERLLGPAAGEKLAALAWNRDPRRNQDAPPRAIGRRAVGARQEACRWSGSSGRRCVISPTASARGSAPNPWPAGP